MATANTAGADPPFAAEAVDELFAAWDSPPRSPLGATAHARPQPVGPARRPLGCRRWMRTVGVATCLVVAACCFLMSMPDSPLHSTTSRATLAGNIESPRIATRSIEHLDVGMRALGSNPRADQVEAAPEPDPQTSRKLVIRMSKESGGTLFIRLLRSVEWIEAVGAVEGGTFFLDLPEMGAVGEAYVADILPCPSIPKAAGNVITGVFAHQADSGQKILRIAFANGAVIQGVTENHPFYSVDRGEFIPAGEMREGESVQVRDGTTAIAGIESRWAAPGEMLYNLETYNEHVYQVTAAGVVVHNTCASNLRRSMTNAGMYGDPGTVPHHIVARFDQRAARCQAILARYRIDLDSHWNGVYLPTRQSRARGAIHDNLHTAEYYEVITQRLRIAEGKDRGAGVLRELQKIRAELLDGSFSTLLPRNTHF